MLPPAEIRFAILKAVDECLGIDRDELVTVVSRKFGFSSTSAQLRKILEIEIDHLQRHGVIRESSQSAGHFIRPQLDS